MDYAGGESRDFSFLYPAVAGRLTHHQPDRGAKVSIVRMSLAEPRNTLGDCRRKALFDLFARPQLESVSEFRNQKLNVTRKVLPYP